MIAFTVPGLPVGKGRPKVVKIAGFTRMATPAKTVAYEGLVAHSGQLAMAGQPPLLEAVHVELYIGVPVPQSWSGKKQRAALAGEVFPTTKPDSDNVVKAIFDGLNGVVWRDDVQVVSLKMLKRYDATPGVRVSVAEMQVPVQREIAA